MALALEDGGFALSFTAYDWGSNHYRSAGDPSLPDDITLW